ncbi:metal ABC transporter ATP-binding protein [Clostridium sp. Marseille-P2415]|uniref:metal ABC transporter ATP-binding protein n=1 Tax=Clostridium sp. Marseille-P2415 TaxID=1805471 RepID=UPI0009887A2E|nr:metal ABC transporter ATP-binding protein [Clostridium sp. Marseille-P2415]
MNAIEIKGLAFSYGSAPVLEGVDLSVPKGRFAALIGANGAGKSTLIKLLLGELPLTGETGSLKLMGHDLRQFHDWKDVGYVSQNGMASYKDFPASVEEIVQANLYARIGMFRFAGKKEKEQVHRALCQVGMEPYRKRLIGKLSGGQQQRVLLARALVNKPQLLILDEPTSGVDERNTEEFYRLIRKFNREEGVTVFMVTHDRKHLQGLADDIWQLEDGGMKRIPNDQEADDNGNI